MSDITVAFLEYLATFNKEKPVYLVNIKKEILKQFQKEVSVNQLEEYFNEKGFRYIYLKEKEETKDIEQPGKEDGKSSEYEIGPDKHEIAVETNIYRGNTYLVSKYQKERDKELLNEILLNNSGLVKSIAARYINYTHGRMDLDDLMNEGYIGLMIAVEKFDPTLGNQFSTYATKWIRQSITRAISNKAYMIRVPVHMQETIRKVLRWERKSILQFNEVREEWVVEQLGITIEKYEEVKKVDHMFLHLASLDTVVTEEDNHLSLFDFIEYTPLVGLGDIGKDFLDPKDITMDRELRRTLQKYMELLKNREREILEHRFGWNDDHPRKLEEIGKIYSLSRERIRKIVLSAVKKLKDNMEKDGFLDESF